MRCALEHVVKEDPVRGEISEVVTLSLRKNAQAGKAELALLLRDEQQQPITYNHYYTDNIQRARQDSTKSAIEKVMADANAVCRGPDGKLHNSNDSVDGEKLLAALQQKINVDMDNQACEEALAGLDAYYKVR